MLRNLNRVDDPDQLDGSRSPTLHLKSNLRYHHWLGVALAKLEERIAIPEILSGRPILALYSFGIDWNAREMSRQRNRIKFGAK